MSSFAMILRFDHAIRIGRCHTEELVNGLRMHKGMIHRPNEKEIGPPKDHLLCLSEGVQHRLCGQIFGYKDLSKSCIYKALADSLGKEQAIKSGFGLWHPKAFTLS